MSRLVKRQYILIVIYSFSLYNKLLPKELLFPGENFGELSPKSEIHKCWKLNQQTACVGCNTQCAKESLSKGQQTCRGTGTARQVREHPDAHPCNLSPYQSY